MNYEEKTLESFNNLLKNKSMTELMTEIYEPEVVKMEYYVICLRHMSKKQFCFEWWFGTFGYTYALNKAWKITKDMEKTERFFDGNSDDFAIPVEIVDKITEAYQMNMDGWEDAKIVRNLPETREILGIDLKRLGSGADPIGQYFRKFNPKNFKK